ncbi:MAG: hypothetical protein LBK97_08150 [Prevotellaceae bacterium]|nr:hypothetical protein [Prevotellaceae bacterium]
MKNILLWLLAAVMTACSAGQQSAKKTDLDKAGLKGRVKSVKEFRYKAVEKPGEMTGEEILFAFDKYDKKGNVTERNSCNTDGRGSKYTYEYDGKENMIEILHDDNDGRILSKCTYEYDEKGYLMKENIHESSDGIYVNTYKYDEKGKKIAVNRYNPDGRLYWTFAWKYDEKGNTIEESGSCPDGEYTYKYKYDENGNRTESSVYTSDGSSNEKSTYEYDEKGNIIEKINYNDAYIDGKLGWKYTYKYDRQGNWIEKTTKYKDESSKSGEPNIIRRKIEYY